MQRKIRGNHLALVDEGRAGKDVAVLDHFKLTYDSSEKGQHMDKEEMAKDEDVSLESLAKLIGDLARRLDAIEATDEDKDKDDDNDVNVTVENEDDVEAERELKDEDRDNEIARIDREEDEEILRIRRDAEEKRKNLREGRDSESIREIGVQDAAEIKRSVMKEISQRDALARQLVPHIGVFDHSEMTTLEVAKYGTRKLGIQCAKGSESAVLTGYLAAAKAPVSSARAMDSVGETSCVDAFLKGVN